ncbi:putative aarF domain-containing protein kinase 1 [Borealophlyctis nickersoniae]|nr:putative aarF domain-containing protein kinase 1 [Borealophlyctis nickersoniae]
MLAFVRSLRTAICAIRMGIDYKWSLLRGPDDIGVEEYERVKSACHTRCAKRLLQLCETNGGIYLKLGQHIAALVFLLPVEYTNTFRVLFDQCPPTSLEDVERLFRKDLNCTINDLFASFDPKPLGVASLAQVHRATLPNGHEVAVKIQHPHLDDHAPVDIATTARLVYLAKKAFPEFEFDWLAEEMQKSLPQELDFEHEANNAETVRKNFNGADVMKIPKVYWAKRRVLVMEFVKGKRIDDLSFLKANAISPHHVSEELTKAYSEMIFLHGFVHCDPHPGNIFVRPVPPPRWHIPLFSGWFSRRHNFDIVLLDHGLYRTLTDSFRLDYARLWAALIAGDERGIEDYSYRLFTQSERVSEAGVDHHRLFASMLTGRTWDAIQGEGGLSSSRSKDEANVMRDKATEGRFFMAIAQILAKLPRELLLLLKTNDLLRAVDDALGVSSGATSHLIKMMATMGCVVVVLRSGHSARDSPPDAAGVGARLGERARGGVAALVEGQVLELSVAVLAGGSQAVAA